MPLATPSAGHDEMVAALRERAGVRALDDQVIRVRGEDRASWLAGVVTQDVRDLRPGQSRYTAVVHVKGKLLADAWVFAREGETLLVVPAGTADGLLQHFERQIVMEDVETSLAPELAVLSVQGPRAAEAVPPGLPDAFAADRLGRGGVDVLVAGGGESPAVRDAIARGAATVVTDAAWEVARLEAGVPRWGVDFGPDNYVQEADITPRAVSFNKGCYVGQEVVCRLEMRGHVRRQLASLVLDGDPPAPGTPAGEGGAVTSSAFSPALGRAVAIAMVKWDVATSGGVVDVGGRPATIVKRPLP